MTCFSRLPTKMATSAGRASFRAERIRLVSSSSAQPVPVRSFRYSDTAGMDTQEFKRLVVERMGWAAFKKGTPTD